MCELPRLTRIKTGSKFKGVMPHVLKELSILALDYNRDHPRNFTPEFNCISIAMSASTILRFGANKYKTHTFTKKMYHDHNLKSIHAEADMVMKLLKFNEIKKVTDIITIRGTSKLLPSHPCKVCTVLFSMYFDAVRLWYYDGKVWVVELI